MYKLTVRSSCASAANSTGSDSAVAPSDIVTFGQPPLKVRATKVAGSMRGLPAPDGLVVAFSWRGRAMVARVMGSGVVPNALERIRRIEEVCVVK